MSNYNFLPPATFGLGEEPFVLWEGGFNDEDIANIIAMGESREAQAAGVGTAEHSEENPEVRRSKISWIDLQPDSEWLYDRLATIASNLNGQFYRFDLYGFHEHFQYTVYDSNNQGHYAWHIDSGTKLSAPRKFSLVLQLSDPSEYEGGDLELFYSADPVAVKKEKGIVAAFPSHTLHRVTPVTAGVRRSLVMWCVGPALK